MPGSTRRFREYVELARYFTARDLRERFLGSLSGSAWALLAPVAQLLVLWLVFGMILRVRLPDADPNAFLPFLVGGLWPWVAFSEGILRGMGAINERAALISKVALPRSVLVLAPVASSFLLHGAGYLAVLVVVAVIGHDVAWQGLALALPLWIVLGVFSTGVALVLATLAVFVRDTTQVVPQLVALFFYLTPIFYPLTILPERLRGIALGNPLTAFVGLFRHAWFGHPVAEPAAWVVAPLAAIVVLGLGVFVFRRASRHFEDFL